MLHGSSTALKNKSTSVAKFYQYGLAAVVVILSVLWESTIEL